MNSHFEEKPRKPFFRAAAISFGPILLFLTAMTLVVHGRGLPDRDYWAIVRSLINSIDGAPSISDFYVRSNEHIVAAAKIFYLLNYYITSGDNIGLSFIACSFAFIIAVTASRVLSKDRKNNVEIAIIGTLSSVLAFSPLAIHNFLLGMSGIAWIGANLFTVLAAYCFWRASEKEHTGLYVVSVVLAILASQFYSTGITALCAVGIQALTGSKTRKMGFVLIGAGLALIISLALIQVIPGSHPARDFNPFRLAVFVFAFLGGGLSGDKDIAIALGIVGSLIAGAVLVRTISAKDDNLQASVWIALMAFAVFTGGIAAIGRSNMSDGAALSGRYAAVPALFWMAVFGATTSILHASRVVRAACTAVFGCAVILVIASGIPRIIVGLERASWKDLATLAISKGVEDSVLNKNILGASGFFYSRYVRLQEIDHVPFNGRDFGCPELGEQLRTVEFPDNIRGAFDAARLTDSTDWTRVNGWVGYKELSRPPLLKNDFLSSYKCLAIIDDSKIVVGFALGGFPRDDVQRSLKARRNDFGWIGYVNRPMITSPSSPAPVYAAISTASGWAMLPRPFMMD